MRVSIPEEHRDNPLKHLPKYSAYSVSRPLRLSRVPTWTDEIDVIVAGFGIAGACAAIEARRNGARVSIFELSSASGGSAALSGGEFYLGGGTSAQKAAGFDDDIEDFRKYMMMAGGAGADRERVDIYVDNAVEHYQWLQGQGIPFKGTYLPGKWVEPHTDDTLVWSGSESGWPYVEHAKPAPRGHAAQIEGSAGRIVMEKLAERIDDLGVETHFNARVLALIADEDNEVHGVVVRIGGEARFFRARKGVILCAGGFICNPDMVRRFVPEALAASENPISGGNDNGSGICMGMSVGGAVSHMDQILFAKPTFPPDSLVKGVFVNERGQRFVNEDIYHGSVAAQIFRQPNRRAWLLLDNAVFARPTFRPDIEISAVGETWEEIEQELGLPEGELQHTMEAYNRYAAAGNDPIHHKDPKWMQPLVEPPFAALNYSSDSYPDMAMTLGGLLASIDGEVLDSQGEPIRGLYAAGRTVCGLPRSGMGYNSGMSLGDSSFFGRRTGRHAAKVNS